MTKRPLIAVSVILLVWGVSVRTLRSSQDAVFAPVRDHFPVIVTDDLGRSFPFDSPPQRIISLSPGYTETLFALGVGDRVVGVDQYSDYPSGAALKPKVGGGAHTHSLEQIVSLHPDLVVVLLGQDVIDALAPRGIRVLKLFPNDLEGILHSLLLLGEVTGTERRAREIADGMKARFERIRSRVKGLPPPRIFFELDGSDPSRPFTPGPRSFIGDMMSIAGGWNIAQNVRTSSTQISLEAIVAADPEIVVLGDANNPVNPQTREDVLRRVQWYGITAIRKGAVYEVDNALFFRPGPRVVEGIETLARLFHPEAFR